MIVFDPQDFTIASASERDPATIPLPATVDLLLTNEGPGHAWAHLGHAEVDAGAGRCISIPRGGQIVVPRRKATHMLLRTDSAARVHIAGGLAG